MPYNFSMSPEEVVHALYKHLLGRDADQTQGWADLIRQSNDPTVALKGILESEEYKLKHPDLTRSSALQSSRAYERLARRPRIVDVGAQTFGSHAYLALMRYCPIEVTGFDPLRNRLAERVSAEGEDGLTLLPYAVGDGKAHTLYINNQDATSSLFPLNVEYIKQFTHLAQLQTVKTETLETYTLDDLLPRHQIDFLKLDVQGAELMVLQGATETLKATAVIHCEVEFGPIYKDQPLFSDVEQFLGEQEFYFVDFVDTGRYSYIHPDCAAAPDRLLWADAVFFRRTVSTEMRAAQALVAAVVYQKGSLAAHLLDA